MRKTTEADCRNDLLEELNSLKQENTSLTKELACFDKCDPSNFKQKQTEVKAAQTSAILWTDNLFELQNWIKN